MIKCFCCNKEIPGEYYLDWTGRCSCLSHRNSKVYRCISCYKDCLITEGIIDGTNTFVCNSCLRTSVKPKDLNRIVRESIELLNHVGFEDILYDHFECKLASREEIDALVPGCLGLHQSHGYDRDEKGVYNLKKEIILIYKNLIEIEFRAVLTHEILHSWQLHNNLDEYIYYNNANKAVEIAEGFAMMGFYLVYNNALKQAPDSKKKYLEYRLNTLKEDKRPAYGIAFQHILNQFNDYGGCEIEKWRHIIKCARKGELKV